MEITIFFEFLNQRTGNSDYFNEKTIILMLEITMKVLKIYHLVSVKQGLLIVFYSSLPDRMTIAHTIALIKIQ